MEFSSLLRRRRQKSRLTQAAFAQRVGVTQQTVARWERGGSTPTKDTLTSIAHTFGEPADKWIRVAGRETASDHTKLLPVRPRIDYLPLGELRPSEFERFTYYLLAAYYGPRVTPVGSQGHAQHGADILVHTCGGIQLFQCKRVQRFGPAQMRAVAEAAAATDAAKRVLVLSHVASPTVRSEAESLGWDIWDHDEIVRLLQQELSTEAARKVFDVFFPAWKEDFLGIRGESPWASPEEFFAGQTEKSTLFSHAYELVGRESKLAQVLEWAQGDRPFLLVTGAAGVGKSRFLMEVARLMDANEGRSVVCFVDNAVDLEAFRRLGDDWPHFVFVDDAHDREDLNLIARGVYTCSNRQRPLRVLLATRDYGERRIKGELAEHAKELEPLTVHLDPLATADARQLAAHVLEVSDNHPWVLHLAAVTEDCTLLLVTAGYLLKTRHVAPALLNDSEGFRNIILDKMYDDYVQGVGDLPGGVCVTDLLQFLTAIQPFDLNDEDAQGAASRVLGCSRDALTSALDETVKIGVVVRRRSRVHVKPDLLADHILVRACYARTLRRATGYSERIWQNSSVGLRHNLIINIARIDWRLSTAGMSPESMIDEAWGVLEQEFKEGGIPQRLGLLDLLQKLACYQPEQVLKLVDWALKHELPPEQTKLGRFEYELVRLEVAPVLRVCAYHREWLPRACELLWRLAISDQRATNPNPEHPTRILCDLADYSLYRPFDHTQHVVSQAIYWLCRDREKLVFDILERALMMELDDHISDRYSIKIYSSSVLVIGKENVLALRNAVLTAVIRQVRSGAAPLAVRAAECLKRALSLPVGIHGRKPTREEIAVWEDEGVRLLQQIHDEVDGVRLSPPVVVALRDAVEAAMRPSNEAIARKLLDSVGDALDCQVVEVLIHGPWRWHHRSNDYSEENAQRRLSDLACRFLEDCVDTPAAVERVEQLLAEASASTDASGAGQFVRALVDQSLCVGIKIIHRVIADVGSSLAGVVGTTLSAIRRADADKALEYARTLVNTGIDSVRMSVSYAYGWGLSSAPTVSIAELEFIRKLAADNDDRLALQLSHGLRYIAERDPRMALVVILEMRIGRSRHLVIEVLSLFIWGPLCIDKLDSGELDGIVEELVACSEIDDYSILKFLVYLARSDLQSVIRLLQRRVEYWESLEDSDDYRPVPFNWNKECRLESRGVRDRRRILEELRDWAAAKDDWRRRYEAPRLFAAVASEFDDEVLDVIELGLKEPAAIASNVANLLSEVPHEFAWSRVRWLVRVLDDADRRDAVYGTELRKDICDVLYSALTSGVRTGIPGEPFQQDVEQRDNARKIADGLPMGSPGERFYRNLQRMAEHAIEWHSER